MRDLNATEQQQLSDAWEQTILKSLEHKGHFTKEYKDAERFAFESHDFTFADDFAESGFQVTVPKAWEFQRIYRALIGFKEPVRTVRPRFSRKEDPRVPFAKVSQDLLNYQASELNLKVESRDTVDESLLGAGVMWLEEDPTTNLFGHYAGSIMDLAIDPDAETMKDAWWVARRKRMPRWEIASMFDVALDDVKLPRSTQQSSLEAELVGNSDGASRGRIDLEKENGKTNELLEIWEVWSKMGIGFRSKQAGEKAGDDATAKADTEYPDMIHFYVIRGSKRLWGVGDWPVPLGLDNDWPCTMLAYAKKRRYVWPVSILGPALGLQKAADWIAAMILNKLKTTSRDFVATLTTLQEDIESKIKDGGDLELLHIDATELGEGKGVNDLISFLQHPPMNSDIWRVWDMVMELFEKASGLYAALYGKSGRTQARSAEEVKDRRDRSDLRPDEMRRIVEEFHALLARKEMIAMRLYYEPDFVAQILGPEAAEIWGQYRSGDVEGAEGGTGRIFREYDFRVESASTTKPDATKERENALDAFDRLVQLALQIGDIAAANELSANMQETLGIPEDKRVQFNPPQPQEEQADPTAEVKVEQEKIKLAQMQVELQIAEAKLAEARAKAAAAGAQQAVEEPFSMPDGPDDIVAIEGGLPVRAGEQEPPFPEPPAAPPMGVPAPPPMEEAPLGPPPMAGL